MTVEVAPGFIQADTYSAEILRRAIGAAYQRGATIGSGVGGLVGATDCLITTAASGRKINVAPGELWVPGSGATQGLYYFRVSATEVLECAAEEANPRMDRIVARVYDAAYSGVKNEGKLEVIKGTANVSAAFPGATSAGVAAQPESSYTLGYVLVPKATKEPLEAKDIENSATVVGSRIAEGQNYGAEIVRAEGTGEQIGAELIPSTAGATQVTVNGIANTVSAILQMNVFCGGQELSRQVTVATGFKAQTAYSFICPAGAKWKGIVIVSSGTGQLVSRYLPL